MENQPNADPCRSRKRAPLTDLTNTQDSHSPAQRTQQSGQGWYARMSDDKKAEYLKRRREIRQQKKDATLSAVNNVHVSQSSVNSLQSLQRTPFTNLTNTLTQGTSPDGGISAECKQRSAQAWYSQLPNKAASSGLTDVELQPCNLQVSHGVNQFRSAQSGVTMVRGTPSSGSVMMDDNGIDWLHSNLTYQRQPINVEQSASTQKHGRHIFLPKSHISGCGVVITDKMGSDGKPYMASDQLCDSSSTDNKRRRRRERYSLMAAEHKEAYLHKNREYKRNIRQPRALSEQPKTGATNPNTSPSSPPIQVQPARDNPTDNTNRDEESFANGIFEPMEPIPTLEECFDTITEDQTGVDDYEDCRTFTAQGEEYESYRVPGDVASGIPYHDPYDGIYKNLPARHHVLKPARDCDHCGAMRFQYEGPAFCCRKGKVNIFTPEVPQELHRLFTSLHDEDAKYFRQHIRYFNSHFSFTSLGVTLDHQVSTAAGTGVYTFHAHGQLYHRLDHLVPGSQGPRHLQLYIYDTDETLEHRVQRSPDLDINLIRKILRILDNNPYVQTFKRVGSVPNLAEYKISLNTDIKLDQRRYNAPTTSQVAAMWVEGSDPQNTFDRSVIVHGKGDRPLYIRAYYGCYDPLAYPLFFPGGETGWNRKMSYDGPASVQANGQDDTQETEDMELPIDDNDDHDEDEAVESTKYVSAREYYCYKLQVRKNIFNIMLYGGRLFQQWIVDMYIKMETMRLDFYSKPENQKLIRADLYQIIW